MAEAANTMPCMIDNQHRQQYEQWLLDVTAIPTAAGREGRVIAWVRRWVKDCPNLQIKEDKAGNLLITRMKTRSGTATSVARNKRPLFITAHMDHPAFVVRETASGEHVELEFRGGVHDPYFENASIHIFDSAHHVHPATITKLDTAAKPFKRVTARLPHPADSIAPGDIGRWAFERDDTLPRIENGLLHTQACDDLAAVAASLSTLDVLHNRNGCEHVGVLLTRAEEIGFVGAIAACKLKSVSKKSRLICLENSRSFPESPIGGGAIMRVGDKLSVFNPTLTNHISLLLTEHQKTNPNFKWQRKLMPGGTCEATTFSTYGYESTCICLPLGNYHNMVDIDGVLAGKRPAMIGPEIISIDDYHSMIEMLIICATQLDSANLPSMVQRMEQLYEDGKHVLKD